MAGSTDDEPKDVVQDASADIAQNAYNERIVVGVPGRVRSERIFVALSGAGKRSKESYKPDLDAPTPGQTVSIIASGEEKEGRSQTKQHVVVGIVLADTPLEYSDKSLGNGGKNKRLADERAKRGLLPPQSRILRATTPVTDFIESGSHKYYVACHSNHGICNMRVITSDAIFFFEEIWSQTDANANLKNRRTALGQVCRKMAAKVKSNVPRALTLINEPSCTMSNDLATSRTDHEINRLWMQFSLWEVSKHPADLHATIQTAKEILPELAKRPSNAGTVAFYCFSQALEEAEAKEMIEEMKATYPSICPLNVNLVLKLHDSLRKNDLGGSLPYGNLAIFLELAHDRANVDQDSYMMTEIVRGALQDIALMNRYQPAARQILPSDDNRAAALTGMISSTRAMLQVIQSYQTRAAAKIREQHGGITVHDSIDGLMRKIGNTVDRTSFMVLIEQVFAINAQQACTALTVSAEWLEDVCERLAVTSI